MNNQITPVQRQQVAQHWRASSEAQNMPPQQAEQFAQQILSGGADNQFVIYLSQLPAPQAQSPSALPGFMQMPIFQPMQPMQFPAMPQMPGMPQFPAMSQMVATMAPMSPPQIPGMPALPMALFGAPQVTQQTTRSGNTTFSYSSGSTMGSWSTPGAHHAIQQTLPASQGYPRPIAIEAAAPTPGFVQSVPPTPVQPVQTASARYYAPPGSSPSSASHAAPSHIPTYPQQAPVAQEIPAVSMNTASQNTRLNNAFAQQMDNEHHDTYFSNPPGAGDRTAPPPPPQPPRQRRKQNHPECGLTCPACDGDGGAIHDREVELGDEIFGRR
ncbi:hypothetical protein LTR65_009348 [Meristemomyces frigidus]